MFENNRYIMYKNVININERRAIKNISRPKHGAFGEWLRVWPSCLPDVSCRLQTDGKRVAPDVVVRLHSFKAAANSASKSVQIKTAVKTSSTNRIANIEYIARLCLFKIFCFYVCVSYLISIYILIYPFSLLCRNRELVSDSFRKMFTGNEKKNT